MRNAKKTEFILDLEKDQPNPFEEILEPKAIISRSIKALGMRGAMTVSDAVPELSRIARKEGKDLNIVKDFQHCVRILDMNKL